MNRNIQLTKCLSCSNDVCFFDLFLVCLLDYERKFKLPPGTIIDAIRSNGETGAWAKLDRGELTMESFVKPFNEECSAKVRFSVYCRIGNDSEHVINQNLLKNLGIIKFGLKSAPICVNV